MRIALQTAAAALRLLSTMQVGGRCKIWADCAFSTLWPYTRAPVLATPYWALVAGRPGWPRAHTASLVLPAENNARMSSAFKPKLILFHSTGLPAAGILLVHAGELTTFRSAGEHLQLLAGVEAALHCAPTLQRCPSPGDTHLPSTPAVCATRITLFSISWEEDSGVQLAAEEVERLLRSLAALSATACKVAVLHAAAAGGCGPHCQGHQLHSRQDRRQQAQQRAVGRPRQALPRLMRLQSSHRACLAQHATAGCWRRRLHVAFFSPSIARGAQLPYQLLALRGGQLRGCRAMA